MRVQANKISREAIGLEENGPAWRSLRVDCLLMFRGRPRRNDDEFIGAELNRRLAGQKDPLRSLKALGHPAALVPGPEVQVLPQAAAIFHANHIQRWEIEVGILKGMSVEAIGEASGVPCSVIAAFEALYFDARSMVGNADWIDRWILGTGCEEIAPPERLYWHHAALSPAKPMLQIIKDDFYRRRQNPDAAGSEVAQLFRSIVALAVLPHEDHRPIRDMEDRLRNLIAAQTGERPEQILACRPAGPLELLRERIQREPARVKSHCNSAGRRPTMKVPTPGDIIEMAARMLGVGPDE